MNSYANVLNMVLKLQHYSLPCFLYKIKVEERLEDLPQNYVRLPQIMVFSGGKPVSYTGYHISLANICCLEFQGYITDTRMITDNPKSRCDLLLTCCTQISSTQKLLREQLHHTLLVKYLRLYQLCTPCYATLLFIKKMLIVFSAVNIFRTFSPHCLLQYMKYALQT